MRDRIDQFTIVIILIAAVVGVGAGKLTAFESLALVLGGIAADTLLTISATLKEKK